MWVRAILTSILSPILASRTDIAKNKTKIKDELLGEELIIMSIEHKSNSSSLINIIKI